MKSPDSGTRQSLATAGRIVLVLCLVVGVVLGAVAGWGLVDARQQEASLGPDVPLVGGEVVVPMTEGWERTVYVDGRSLEEAECTVTAPDGAVETLEGFDTVGRARLGTRPLGDFTAEQAGEYAVQCTGVQEASVSDERDAGRDGLRTFSLLAGLLLVAGVLPLTVISLVTWRWARRA